ARHWREIPLAGGDTRRKDQRGACVIDATGVARCHHTALLETRWELSQLFRRGVANALVTVHHNLLALAILYRDWHNLLGEPSLLPCIFCRLLAAQGVGIHCLAVEAILFGEVLGSVSHATPTVPVHQRLPERVLQSMLSQGETGAGSADDERRLRHIFGTANQGDRPFTQEQRLRAANNGLQ